MQQLMAACLQRADVLQTQGDRVHTWLQGLSLINMCSQNSSPRQPGPHYSFSSVYFSARHPISS